MGYVRLLYDLQGLVACCEDDLCGVECCCQAFGLSGGVVQLDECVAGGDFVFFGVGCEEGEDWGEGGCRLGECEEFGASLYLPRGVGLFCFFVETTDGVGAFLVTCAYEVVEFAFECYYSCLWHCVRVFFFEAAWAFQPPQPGCLSAYGHFAEVLGVGEVGVGGDDAGFCGAEESAVLCFVDAFPVGVGVAGGVESLREGVDVDFGSGDGGGEGDVETVVGLLGGGEEGDFEFGGVGDAVDGVVVGGAFGVCPVDCDLLGRFGAWSVEDGGEGVAFCEDELVGGNEGGVVFGDGEGAVEFDEGVADVDAVLAGEGDEAVEGVAEGFGRFDGGEEFGSGVDLLLCVGLFDAGEVFADGVAALGGAEADEVVEFAAEGDDAGLCHGAFVFVWLMMMLLDCLQDGGYGLCFGFEEHAGDDGEDGDGDLDDFAPGFA